ncbi:MAG: tetratricopeptide repeat protein [Pirellula sp.]
MTKLLRFFEKYRSQSEREAKDSQACCDRWIDMVRTNYSTSTLHRLLSSQQAEIRQAAAWALSYLGDESHAESLGFLLRDSTRVVRSYADAARRAIDIRTQSPWHRKTAMQVEHLLAEGLFSSASELATNLVDEADTRADVYMLRAWVRFSDGRIESAAEDCKRTLALDPFCYQACVALGQCLWHLGRDLAARECYSEAARIYPDWEPARAALQMLPNANNS